MCDYYRIHSHVGVKVSVRGLGFCRLLLGHGERQVVVGHLDLVLRLQVSHPVGADAIDGDDDITLHQVSLRRLAARSDLSTRNNKHNNHMFPFQSISDG